MSCIVFTHFAFFKGFLTGFGAGIASGAILVLLLEGVILVFYLLRGKRSKSKKYVLCYTQTYVGASAQANFRNLQL